MLLQEFYRKRESEKEPAPEKEKAPEEGIIERRKKEKKRKKRIEKIKPGDLLTDRLRV